MSGDLIGISDKVFSPGETNKLVKYSDLFKAVESTKDDFHTYWHNVYTLADWKSKDILRTHTNVELVAL